MSEQEQASLPTIERVIIEEPEPAHKPPRRRRSRSKAAQAERVTVDDAKAAPKGRKPAPIGKTLAKDVETFTVTAFDVAQWVSPFVPQLQPSRLSDGTPIWPIDRTDAQDVANLKSFAENAAKLINRLPDKVRRYLVVSMSGGAVGAEVIGFIQGMYYLIMSRLITQQMAAMDTAQAATDAARAQAMPVNPWPAQETAAD